MPLGFQLVIFPGLKFNNVVVSDSDGVNNKKIETVHGTKSLENTPLVSFKIGDKIYFSNQKESIENLFQIEVIQPEIKNGGWHTKVVFTNISKMLLRVSQGFERKATVGFRCVADLEN